MANLYKLNEYQSGISDKLACFKRFQTILPGKLVRSTQPNYNGYDQEHTLTETDVKELKRRKIGCVISANNCRMKKEAKDLLGKAGIAFFHFKVVDMQPPTKNQLIKASSVIELFGRRGATLVYCGYGQGRTGTVVAAWAMTRYMKGCGASNTDIDKMCSLPFLKHNFGVEKESQVHAIREAVGLPKITAPAPIAPKVKGAAGVSGLLLPPGLSKPAFANFGSAPSGVSLPIITPGPAAFANFGSAPSGVSLPIITPGPAAFANFGSALSGASLPITSGPAAFANFGSAPSGMSLPIAPGPAFLSSLPSLRSVIEGLGSPDDDNIF